MEETVPTVEDTPAEEPFDLEAYLALMTAPVYQVSVRTNDRVVTQVGTFAPSPAHRNQDGTPAIAGGLAPHEGCAVEQVTPEVFARIQEAMPDHGGSVVLSADHESVSAALEPEHYRAMLASVQAQQEEEKAKEEALRAFQAHAIANPNDSTILLARALGLDIPQDGGANSIAGAPAEVGG